MYALECVVLLGMRVAVEGGCAKCDLIKEGKSQEPRHADGGGVNSDGAQTLGKP